MKVTRAGQLTFHSAKDIGDVVYRFTGRLDAAGIAGQLQIVGGAPDNKIVSLPMTFMRLDLSGVGGLPADAAGLYSNVQYSAAGGDLTGAELIVFGHEGKLAVIFTPLRMTCCRMPVGTLSSLQTTSNSASVPKRDW